MDPESASALLVSFCLCLTTCQRQVPCAVAIRDFVLFFERGKTHVLVDQVADVSGKALEGVLLTSGVLLWTLALV